MQRTLFPCCRRGRRPKHMLSRKRTINLTIHAAAAKEQKSNLYMLQTFLAGPGGWQRKKMLKMLSAGEKPETRNNLFGSCFIGRVQHGFSDAGGKRGNATVQGCALRFPESIRRVFSCWGRSTAHCRRPPEQRDPSALSTAPRADARPLRSTTRCIG